MNQIDGLLSKLETGEFLKLIITDEPITPEWVPDNEQPRCLFCSADFSTFNRRHHCRQCGRIFCSKCIINYPDENKPKICRLCHEIIEMDTKLKSFEAYDLSEILIPEITRHLRSPDVYYLSEVIRLFENQMKNERTRKQFLGYFRGNELLEVMAFLSNELQISENITSIFNFLGLFINLTAERVPDNTPREIVFFALRALEFRDELCIQEAATLLLANISTSYEFASECLAQSDLITRCFTLLKAAAPTVRSHVFCIICNLVSYFPEKLECFLPSQDLNNMIAKHMIFRFINASLKSEMPDEATQTLRLCWILYERRAMRALFKKYKIDVFASIMGNFSFKMESAITNIEESDLNLEASLYFAIKFYAFSIESAKPDSLRFGGILIERFDFFVKLLADDPFSAKCAIFLLDMLANEMPVQFSTKIDENSDIFKETINGIIDGNSMTLDVRQHLDSILEVENQNETAVILRREWLDCLIKLEK